METIDLIMVYAVVFGTLIAIPLIIKLIEGKKPYIGNNPKCIYCKGNRCFYCMYTGIKQTGQYKND